MPSRTVIATAEMGAGVKAIGTTVVLVQEHEASKYANVVHGVPLIVVTRSYAVGVITWAEVTDGDGVVFIVDVICAEYGIEEEIVDKDDVLVIYNSDEILVGLVKDSMGDGVWDICVPGGVVGVSPPGPGSGESSPGKGAGLSSPGTVVGKPLPGGAPPADDGTIVAVSAGTEAAVVGTWAAHVCGVTTSSLSVTAAFNAYSPPATVTPLLSEIEVKARTVPAKIVVVPSVADEPTCQNTLHACAPLMRTTDDSVSVIRVDPIWKTKSAFGSPWPSRVSTPVMPTAAAEK